MDRLVHAFVGCEKLQEHMRFLLAKGGSSEKRGIIESMRNDIVNAAKAQMRFAEQWINNERLVQHRLRHRRTGASHEPPRLQDSLTGWFGRDAAGVSSEESSSMLSPP